LKKGSSPSWIFFPKSWCREWRWANRVIAGSVPE
jgi:hypothetical protein